MTLSTVYKTESAIIRLSKVVFWSIQALSLHLSSVIRGESTSTSSSWKDYRRWSILENLALLNIFRNNCFDLRSPKVGQALFKRISRLNHSCVPNAQGNYHPLHETFNIHSTSDIKAGDEITVSYLPEKCQTRNQRIEALDSGYGFQCACPACDMRLEGGIVGEQRRTNMQDIFAIVSECQSQGEEGRDVYLQRVRDLKWGDGKDIAGSTPEGTNLRMIEQFVWTLEQGDVAGREVASLYMEIARLYVKEGKHMEALQNAEKGLSLDEACLGIDHPIYQESLKAVQVLRDHQDI